LLFSAPNCGTRERALYKTHRFQCRCIKTKEGPPLQCIKADPLLSRAGYKKYPPWVRNQGKQAALTRTQLGYTESTRNYEVMEDGETIKGCTRYGEWYGMPYDDRHGAIVLHLEGLPREGGQPGKRGISRTCAVAGAEARLGLPFRSILQSDFCVLGRSVR
jgi:hypothetical protein